MENKLCTTCKQEFPPQFFLKGKNMCLGCKSKANRAYKDSKLYRRRGLGKGINDW